MNLVVNFDVFYNFLYISALDKPIWTKLVTKLKIFYALNESGKISDRYDPQNFWKTQKAGVKK